MTDATNADSKDRAPAHHPDQNAAQDESLAKRLEKDPHDQDAKLDTGLDESMDASDPPASTAPGDHGEPMPSSGYDEDEEAKRKG